MISLILYFFGIALGQAAEPPFLQAQAGKPRCAAIQEWIDSITVLSRGGAANARTEEIMRYAAPGFHKAIGKHFAELSGSERKDIAGSLRKCTKERWIEVILTRPFEMNPTYPEAKEWAQAFTQGARVPFASSPGARAQAGDIFARRAAVTRLIEGAKARHEEAAKEDKEMHRRVMKVSDAALDLRKKGKNAESDLVWREKGVYEHALASVRRRREFYGRLIEMGRMGLPSAADLMSLGFNNSRGILNADGDVERSRASARRELAVAIKSSAAPPVTGQLEKEVAAYGTVRDAIAREWRAYDEFQQAIGAPSILETAQRMELEAQREREHHARLALRRQQASEGLAALVVAGGAAIAVAIILKDAFATDDERKLANEVQTGLAQPEFDPLKLLCEFDGGVYAGGGACVGRRRP